MSKVLEIPALHNEIRVTIDAPNSLERALNRTEYLGVVIAREGTSVTLAEVNIRHLNENGKPFFSEQRPADFQLKLDLASVRSVEDLGFAW